MTRHQALRRIILPQAFVAMIPPWGNLFIELLKATSLVSLITLADLAFKAQQMNQTTFKTVPIFTLVLLIYLAHSLGHHHRHALAREPRRARPRPRARAMIWDWAFAFEILPLLAQAAIVTIEATLLGFAHRRDPRPRPRLAPHRGAGTAWPISVLVEFIRSTPLLIQIFFLYFVFPKFGVVLDAFTAGVLALGIHYAAYCSEVYRAGFDNIPRGQWEASTALNLSTWTTFRDVIIPQAIPPVVPALGNYLVALFKETPLLSAIAVLELMQTAKIIGSETFRYTEPITLVGVFFLVMSLVSAALHRRRSNATSTGGPPDERRRPHGPLRQGRQALRRPHRARRARPRHRPRREGRDHRPLGLGQDHRAAHADDARDDQRRRHLGRGRAAHPHAAGRPARAGRRPPISAASAPRSAWSSSPSTSSRT